MASKDFRRNNLANDLEGSIEYLANAEAQYPTGKEYFIQNRKKLQEILNMVMDESKPLTDASYNDAYDTLRRAKEDELKFHWQQDKHKVYLYAGMAILGLTGLYLWNKNRKR